MKCLLTNVQSQSACAWCCKKTDCVESSIESTFFSKSLLCWKCLRKAVELRHRQENQQAESKPEKVLK